MPIYNAFNRINSDSTIVSLNLNDFVNYCRIYPDSSNNSDYYDCADITSIVITMQEGHKCFTFFSDIFADVSQRLYQSSATFNKTLILKFDQFPYIDFSIKGKYLQPRYINNLSDKYDSQRKFGIFLSIHTPAMLPDMLSLSSRRLFQKKYSRFRFVKMIEQLQPWPYRTKCFYYHRLNNNLQANVFGSKSTIHRSELKYFRSRGECFLYCMWRQLGHYPKCINFFTIFTQDFYYLEINYRIFLLFENLFNFKNTIFITNLTHLYKESLKLPFCSINSSVHSYGNVKQNCLVHCPEECLADKFWIDTNYNLDINSDSNDSLIRIEWSTEPIVNIKHRKKYTIENFLGHIGGHFHIWLGISVISICRFILNKIQTRSFQRDRSCFWLAHWFRCCFTSVD